MRNFFATFRSSVPHKVAAAYFVALSFWWVTMFARDLHSGLENDIFTNIYGLMALGGGIWGLKIAKEWGGLKSAFGRALFFISLGLLAQFFGQISYNSYIYFLGVEVPYPSIGDLGFFGSVVFYILGTANLFRVTGSHLRYSSMPQILISIVLPTLLLGGSYFVFLQNYDFLASSSLAVILDFAYPLGQAIYVSLALLVFLLSMNTLGGLMRLPMLFLLCSLVFQYFCDYTFLYEVQHDLWYVGGLNDYMYFASYFFMTVSLGYIGYKLSALRSA